MRSEDPRHHTRRLMLASSAALVLHGVLAMIAPQPSVPDQPTVALLWLDAAPTMGTGAEAGPAGDEQQKHESKRASQATTAAVAQSARARSAPAPAAAQLARAAAQLERIRARNAQPVAEAAAGWTPASLAAPPAIDTSCTSAPAGQALDADANHAGTRDGSTLAAAGAGGAGVAASGGGSAHGPLLLGRAVDCTGYFPGQSGVDNGEVHVAVTVDATGHARESTVLREQPRGRGFGSAAHGCVRTLLFSPAVDVAGLPVSGQAKLKLRFVRPTAT